MVGGGGGGGGGGAQQNRVTPSPSLYSLEFTVQSLDLDS